MHHEDSLAMNFVAAALLLFAVVQTAATAETPCTEDTDCAGYKGCTFPDDQWACKCKKGQCRRRHVDCKTFQTHNWGCRDGKTCFREFRGPTWSTCATPAEEQLGMRFLTADEVTAAFNKTEGAAIANFGLVQYQAGGPGAFIESHWSSVMVYDSYDEFQRMCTTKCERNAKCAAVWTWFLANKEALGVEPDYNCMLVAADVEVRGVKAVQLTSSTATSDTVYEKKGHVLPPFEPCQIDFLNLERSLNCTGCLAQGVPLEGCDAMFGTDCYGLLNASNNTDFHDKFLPAVQCLGANATACLPCTQEKMLNVRRSETAGTICTEDDDLNLVRGFCKDECYTGNEDCEGLIQKASLCVASSPLIRDATGSINGLINYPYVCPQVV